jgi:hypothetical protein
LSLSAVVIDIVNCMMLMATRCSERRGDLLLHPPTGPQYAVAGVTTIAHTQLNEWPVTYYKGFIIYHFWSIIK